MLAREAPDSFAVSRNVKHRKNFTHVRIASRANVLRRSPNLAVLELSEREPSKSGAAIFRSAVHRLLSAFPILRPRKTSCLQPAFRTSAEFSPSPPEN